MKPVYRSLAQGVASAIAGVALALALLTSATSAAAAPQVGASAYAHQSGLVGFSVFDPAEGENYGNSARVGSATAFGSAAAAADLSTGQLKAYAEYDSTAGFNGQGAAVAEGYFADIVTFESGSPQSVEVSFYAHVHARITGVGSLYLSWGMLKCMDAACDSLGADPGTNLGYPTNFVSTADVDSSVFLRTAVVETGSRYWTSMTLRARVPVGATGTVDALNTVGLSMALPPSVTYQSQSGVFLSAVSAIPEPSRLMLFVLGACFMVTCFKFRRSQASPNAA